MTEMSITEHVDTQQHFLGVLRREFQAMALLVSEATTALQEAGETDEATAIYAKQQASLDRVLAELGVDQNVN